MDLLHPRAHDCREEGEGFIAEQPRHRAEPIPDRPDLPESYGVSRQSSGAQRPPWHRVDESLARAHTYWLGTTRPDRRPHAVPVYGVWLEGTFYFDTARDSRKGRNLARHPELVVHLESGLNVVILEGVAEEVTDPALFSAYADAYETKYRWRPEQKADRVTYALRPSVAFTWLERDFSRTATRWRFKEA